MIANATNLSPAFDTSASALDRHADTPAMGAVDTTDGSIDHNIDLGAYRGEDKKAAEDLIKEFVTSIDRLDKQAELARARGDEALATHLESRANEFRQAFTELKVQLEGGTLDPKVVSAAVDAGGAGALVEGLLEAAAQPNLTLRAPDRCSSTRDAGATDSVESAKDTDEAFGTSDTASADAKLPAEFEQDPAELAAWFESDPQDFFAKLRELGSEDRGAILMIVQGEIQQTNQVFSMMTNFQSAAHDTQKAMISNLRV